MAWVNSCSTQVYDANVKRIYYPYDESNHNKPLYRCGICYTDLCAILESPAYEPMIEKVVYEFDDINSIFDALMAMGYTDFYDDMDEASKEHVLKHDKKIVQRSLQRKMLDVVLVAQNINEA